jgi:hypothetical protein
MLDSKQNQEGILGYEVGYVQLYELRNVNSLDKTFQPSTLQHYTTRSFLYPAFLSEQLLYGQEFLSLVAMEMGLQNYREALNALSYAPDQMWESLILSYLKLIVLTKRPESVGFGKDKELKALGGHASANKSYEELQQLLSQQHNSALVLQVILNVTTRPSDTNDSYESSSGDEHLANTITIICSAGQDLRTFRELFQLQIPIRLLLATTLALSTQIQSLLGTSTYEDSDYLPLLKQLLEHTKCYDVTLPPQHEPEECSDETLFDTEPPCNSKEELEKKRQQLDKKGLIKEDSKKNILRVINMLSNIKITHE